MAVAEPEASASEPGGLLRLSGSWTHEEVLTALDDAHAEHGVELVPDLMLGFERLLEDPSRDQGEGDAYPAGQLRLAYAAALAELGDARVSSLFVRALRQSAEDQPVVVHKQVIEGLARFGEPTEEVVDALLTVGLRVPDVPSTQSVSERARRALAALGEVAVPRVLVALRLEHAEVNQLASSNGIDPGIVQRLAALTLGSIASPLATDALVDWMPQQDCGGKGPPKGTAQPSVVETRAMAARALGEIGDPRAVAPLCSCRNATWNPGDLWEITTALGRIGGPEAQRCLEQIVDKAEYRETDPQWRYEIRWEGARFMILAALPEDVPRMRKLLRSERNADAREKMTQWTPALDLLEGCGTESACYTKVLADPNEGWFRRELAATQLSRLSAGDRKAALLIAEAFNVPNPSARVTMALLTRKTLAGESCPECAAALRKVMADEQGKVRAEMQPAWITARQVAARLERQAPSSVSPAD